MHRSLITSAGVLLLGASAFAQSSLHSSLRPVTSTVRDAGVYHFGTGTWTRHADTTNGINNDIIYSNTCPTGYYAGMFTKEYIADEGRVPGPNGPVVCDTAGRVSTNVGCACSYTVCGFQIAYCSGLPGNAVVDLNIGFQGAYTACALPSVLPKSAGTFDITGLPGAGLTIQGCWLVTVDLDATSQSFSIPADGASCTWVTGGPATDHLFGWTFQNQTTVTNVGQSYVGPLIAGSGGQGTFIPNPTCSQVDNSRWDTLTCAGQGGGPAKWPNNQSEDGWGMDTQDRFRDDTTLPGGTLAPPSGPGCYYFGGNPGGSFHLKLFANTGCVSSPGVSFCRPIEESLTCPCGNPPTTAGAGCNGLSPGAVPTGGAKLSSTGNAIPFDQPGGEAAAPAPHVTLIVAGLPTNAGESAYLLQGTLTIAPVTFGQGLRCCGGPLKRMQIHSAVPGGTSWPIAGDIAPTISQRSNVAPGAIVHILPGQTYCYFSQYRQQVTWPACPGLPTAFNASNAQNILWHL